MLLTVSPVPLIATYENRHVLQSTTYSKAVLRAVAQEVCDSMALVDYFPSYEIITTHAHKGRYFKEDLRDVTWGGVENVMNVFKRHYLEGVSEVASNAAAPQAARRRVRC